MSNILQVFLRRATVISETAMSIALMMEVVCFYEMSYGLDCIEQFQNSELPVKIDTEFCTRLFLACLVLLRHHTKFHPAVSPETGMSSTLW